MLFMLPRYGIGADLFLIVYNNSYLCMNLGWTVNDLECTFVQPKGCTWIVQVFTFAYVGWWNFMQVRM